MPTLIEWCDETLNPITGCSPISEGCQNCYAIRMGRRGMWGYGIENEFRFHHNRMGQIFHWRNGRKIFVGSMTDMFHEKVQYEWLDDVFRPMPLRREHTFMVLTKRPLNMKAYFDDAGRIPDNLWLGVTLENRQRAAERIPVLLQIDAKLRFVSIEPMLDRVDLTAVHFPTGCIENVLDTETSPRLKAAGIDKLNGIDWVICGAETGPRKRHMDLGWARDLRDQCVAAGIPFFFKKDSDGNGTLDGVEWRQFPERVR